MKKRTGILVLFLLTVLLCTGCTMQTVEQMYRVPKRSQSFDHVQRAMDMAMVGLEYWAPVSGENQQTVQLADLDGDGVDEYLLFARNPSEVPLNILIFDTDEEGTCYLLEVIELQGSAFEKVEYVQIDDKPGLELVVGCQVSDQLMGNVSIYSFQTGRAQRLMAVSYVHFLTCDLDRNDRSELLVIQPGESGQPGEGKATALSYSYRRQEMERSVEVKLSAPASSVERIVEGGLEGGSPGVFISSTVDGTSLVTDVLAVSRQKLTNLMKTDSSVLTLRNYYVYPTDIDGDGTMEIPRLIPMQPVTNHGNPENQYLIHWYSMDLQGSSKDKIYTFHDYGGGWYLELDPVWAERISAAKEGNTHTFYLWDEAMMRARPLFTLFVFTGRDRNQEADSAERFLLKRLENTAYSAEILEMGVACGLTEEYLKDSFHLIKQDWKTGET